MQAVTHLLRIRVCCFSMFSSLLEIITAYNLVPRKRGPSILYLNSHVRLDATTTLASSPIGPSPATSRHSSPA
ncbi:MAG: hypothetical protein J3Q66DRAFT_357371 [Benniella sp.]|nr:MAG: hypothetical protein J3Q66DRAFT_357371 [Benniella sp.]